MHIEDPEDPSVVGAMKLFASFTPTSSTSFTSANWMKALAQYPFGLFLSFPRIVYQAWILHYRKWLNVYARPDPQPSRIVENTKSDRMRPAYNGHGIGWRSETLLERFARKRVENVLHSHADRAGVLISLIPEDPHASETVFAPTTTNDGSQAQHLSIRYQSSRFFTSWLISPSIEHLLLLKDDIEGEFSVSSMDLFRAIRSAEKEYTHQKSTSTAQRLRLWAIPPTLHLDTPSDGLIDLPSPDICLIIALSSSLALEQMERRIFGLVGARFVMGQEPWMRWERALTRSSAALKL